MRTITASRVRQLLRARNARWRIPETMRGRIDLDALAEQYALGAVEPPPGARLRRMPRVSAPVVDRARVFTRGVHPLIRLEQPLPRAWDWRDVEGHNWITPIRDQESCGSCVAFGVTAAAEAHWRILRNSPNAAMDLSEASLFFGAKRGCRRGDPAYGWYIAAALDRLVEEGICDESEYPYVAENQAAQLLRGDTNIIRLRGYDSTTSAAQMKRWLVEEGPLVAGFKVFSDFRLFWSGGALGVYTQISDELRGGHAICVVGYDDDESCWICKNSWGRRGDNGFFRIGYGEVGIDDRMYLPQDFYRASTVDCIPYDPRALHIVSEGDRGWLLTDGHARMKLLDNREDALDALRVARRHTKQCFIGRGRSDYVIEYWDGNSGLPREPLSRTDCSTYDPAYARAVDLGAAGWSIVEAAPGRRVHSLLMAHDMDDALAALHLVQRHRRICHIGRDNRRPNRKDYIMTYWEGATLPLAG